MKTDIQDKTVSVSVLHISVLYKSLSGSLRLKYTLLAYMWHTVYSWQLHYTIPKHVLCDILFSYLCEAVTDYKLTWGNLIMSKFPKVTTFHWLAVQPTYPPTEWMNEWTNETTEPLNERPTEQPINQPTDRPNNQPTNWPTETSLSS